MIKTVEEKAKAYDEAIERAKNYYSTTDSAADIELIGLMFPELTESEDERIRKAIISFLKSPFVNENITDEKVTPWIAWLEKQGEQKKFYDGIQIGDKVTRNEDGVLVNLSQLKRVAKKDEKQGEQKPQGKSALEAANEVKVDNQNCVKPAKVEPKFKVGDTITDPTDSTFTFHINAIKDGKYMESDKDWVLIKEADSDYELVEQKPAWSEEDETALSDALWCCKQAASIAKDENDMGNAWYAERWLKSIKDRVQPQQRQEWSEDVESAIQLLEDMADEQEKDYCPHNANNLRRASQYLKSLRPQSHWKPSDEQLNALYDAAVYVDTAANFNDVWVQAFRKPFRECGVEYTRTDAFIEKACDAYCAICDTKECDGCAECSWVKKFRKYMKGE